VQVERGAEPRKRDRARPEVGPVREKLVVREGIFVDQCVGARRPDDSQSVLPERHLVLQHASSLPLVKKRADVLLVERGLAETRSQAQALVLAGLVRGVAKPGQQVDEGVELVVERPPRFVSRGGEKLWHALETFRIDPAGRDCLDLGASTGGFTDCLLQAGARRVIAVDVGYGQLHPRLRDDTRVTVLERVNARHLTGLAFAPDLVVCDVSFISLEVVMPPALALCATPYEAAVLVKPQFEAGRGEAPKGVVRDPEVHRTVLRSVASAAAAWGSDVCGVVDSGLPGPKGNREFFLHLKASEEASAQDDVDRWIDDAVGSG
jgi:23S rRNA (cytidine1920-2'-O)/16S rRNA (cytidine1409-2'-O)-methyltransferase